ncbi:MAG: hypothetical protein ABIQ05_05825 [Candidatus Limnocylindria bacterium]
MAAVLFRLALLATGLGVTEIGLGNALAAGSPWGWALVLFLGLPLIVAGSAGFMVTLLGGSKQKGRSTDA